VTICNRCGNAYPEERGICPYCFARPSPHKVVSKFLVLNIKKDMPTLDAARRSLVAAVDTARADGVRAIKLVHGYGSTGKGGALAKGLRSSLAKLKRAGTIADWIAGEDFHTTNARVQHALATLPRLRNDPDCGRSNPGVTLVLLSAVEP
jgi:hypothetical protein